MLKKSFRLRKKKDFARVFRYGKPLFFNGFGCKYIKNNLENDRLGFSFSKKYLKTAVLRNRFKRRMVGVYNKRYNFNGVDIVFFLTQPHEKLQSDAIEAFLEKINQKI